jgi:O-methyltransferase
MKIKEWMRRKGISKGSALWPFYKPLVSRWMLANYYSAEKRRIVCRNGDPIRYGTACLALDQISADRIPGAMAECGVHKGTFSKFLHERIPEKKLYLFDTFQGFDRRDSDTESDLRFRDTSVEDVLSYIGSRENIIVRKGYFPETAAGLETERFSFVMIDFDKYEPTFAALRFFYPRMEKGGYIFVHDYNSPESNWACKRAVDGFLEGRSEKSIAVPDAGGSIVFRII